MNATTNVLTENIILKITARIASEIQNGNSIQTTIDNIFGPNTYNKLVSDLYEELKNN